MLLERVTECANEMGFRKYVEEYFNLIVSLCKPLHFESSCKHHLERGPRLHQVDKGVHDSKTMKSRSKAGGVRYGEEFHWRRRTQVLILATAGPFPLRFFSIKQKQTRVHVLCLPSMAAHELTGPLLLMGVQVLSPLRTAVEAKPALQFCGPPSWGK